MMRSLNAPARSLAATAVAALLVGGLAACGGSDGASGSPFGNGNASSDVTSSTSAPAATSSSAGASTATSSAAASGSAVSSDRMKDILTRSVSSVSTAHFTMDMDITAAGRTMTVTSQGDLQTDPLAESMTMDMSGVQMQAMLVDGTMYIKSALFQTGGKWVKMTGKDMDTLGVGSMSTLMSNPLTMINIMGDYIDSATYVGKETVGGVSADHYRMKVQIASMMKKLGMPSSSLSQMPSTANEDIWVDSQGRAVKTQVNMSSLETMTMQLSDFGKQVDLKAPPAGQVTDFSSVPGMGSLAG